MCGSCCAKATREPAINRKYYIVFFLVIIFYLNLILLADSLHTAPVACICRHLELFQTVALFHGIGCSTLRIFSRFILSRRSSLLRFVAVYSLWASIVLSAANAEASKVGRPDKETKIPAL